MNLSWLIGARGKALLTIGEWLTWPIDWIANLRGLLLRQAIRDLARAVAPDDLVTRCRNHEGQ